MIRAWLCLVAVVAACGRSPAAAPEVAAPPAQVVAPPAAPPDDVPPLSPPSALERRQPRARLEGAGERMSDPTLTALAKSDKDARDAYAFLRVAGKALAAGTEPSLAPYLDSARPLCAVQGTEVACSAEAATAVRAPLTAALVEAGGAAALRCSGLTCRLGDAGPTLALARRASGALHLSGYLEAGASDAQTVAWKARASP